jgi:hypothetical protein
MLCAIRPNFEVVKEGRILHYSLINIQFAVFKVFINFKLRKNVNNHTINRPSIKNAIQN